MSQAQQPAPAAGSQPPAEPVLIVAPSPHMGNIAQTTRRMMLDVLLALVPVIVASMAVFGLYAIQQIALCMLACMAFEAMFSMLRGKGLTIIDGSAAVTGAILALSLPWSAPWYVGVVGSLIAIGIAKIIFGGLGQNLFNPAMVGRAFVMIAFAGVMGASAYVAPASRTDAPHAVTQATPMTARREAARKPAVATAPAAAATQPATDWNYVKRLFWGNVNGSLGETSAAACILGAVYLLIRRTASWEIPLGMVGTAAVIAGLMNLAQGGGPELLLHHLFGGALLFGAVYIATDPVTSPLTPRGKLIFGAGCGALVMLLRVFSGYPEGVMFAVLLMNSVVPLINRWTIPTPIGGPAPVKA
ncbi:MAG: RnfABCDGE type electron transport complex subunit D [Planctomycetaceae bacterium]|nr:RnfABCDGE type electron transport complex subunit D [Planctomycetaceae bacterium]